MFFDSSNYFVKISRELLFRFKKPLNLLVFLFSLVALSSSNILAQEFGNSNSEQLFTDLPIRTNEFYVDCFDYPITSLRDKKFMDSLNSLGSGWAMLTLLDETEGTSNNLVVQQSSFQSVTDLGSDIFEVDGFTATQNVRLALCESIPGEDDFVYGAEFTDLNGVTTKKSGFITQLTVCRWY